MHYTNTVISIQKITLFAIVFAALTTVTALPVYADDWYDAGGGGGDVWYDAGGGGGGYVEDPWYAAQSAQQVVQDEWYGAGGSASGGDGWYLQPSAGGVADGWYSPTNNATAIGDEWYNPTTNAPTVNDGWYYGKPGVDDPWIANARMEQIYDPNARRELIYDPNARREQIYDPNLRNELVYDPARNEMVYRPAGGGLSPQGRYEIFARSSQPAYGTGGGIGVRSGGLVSFGGGYGGYGGYGGGYGGVGAYGGYGMGVSIGGGQMVSRPGYAAIGGASHTNVVNTITDITNIDNSINGSYNTTIIGTAAPTPPAPIYPVVPPVSPTSYPYVSLSQIPYTGFDFDDMQMQLIMLIGFVSSASAVGYAYMRGALQPIRTIASDFIRLSTLQ